MSGKGRLEFLKSLRKSSAKTSSALQAIPGAIQCSGRRESNHVWRTTTAIGVPQASPTHSAQTAFCGTLTPHPSAQLAQSLAQPTCGLRKHRCRAASPFDARP